MTFLSTSNKTQLRQLRRKRKLGDERRRSFEEGPSTLSFCPPGHGLHPQIFICKLCPFRCFWLDKNLLKSGSSLIANKYKWLSWSLTLYESTTSASQLVPSEKKFPVQQSGSSGQAMSCLPLHLRQLKKNRHPLFYMFLWLVEDETKTFSLWVQFLQQHLCQP